MCWIIICVLLTISNLGYGQTIHHFETISEIQDSMVLLNKSDVDKINKTFFEKNRLDTLNVLNEQLIDKLNSKNVLLDSIIKEQKQYMCLNDALIKESESKLENYKDHYTKTIKQERNKKLTWQVISGASWLIIILLII